jgi:hypothetical protein
LITADRSGGLACWQVPSGKPLGRVSRTDAMITCPVACAPDGLTWAVGWQTRAGADCRVQLWEAATCQVRKEWPGHGGTITALAFAPDGRTLASGSADTTILLWDLRADLAAARRHHPRLTPEEAAAQWGLLSGDAATAYPAQLRFAVAPADALAFLRDRLPPVPGQPPTPETLARWVADLGAEAFAVREQAARALDQAGDAAEPALRQALAGRPREEVRRRLEALLDRPPGTPSPETLRGLRAVEALEWAAPAEARAWLAALARGNPAAALTRAAQAAHRRLEPAAKER